MSNDWEKLVTSEKCIQLDGVKNSLGEPLKGIELSVAYDPALEEQRIMEYLKDQPEQDITFSYPDGTVHWTTGYVWLSKFDPTYKEGSYEVSGYNVEQQVRYTRPFLLVGWVEIVHTYQDEYKWCVYKEETEEPEDYDEYEEQDFEPLFNIDLEDTD